MENKYWYGVGGATVILIAVVVGVFFWQSSKDKEKVSFGAASLNVSDTQQNNSSPTLNKGGISVSSNASGQNLGQIAPTNNQSNSGAGGASSSSSGKSSSQTIDPSTFTQYEKYKNDNQALFGDLVVGTGATLGNGQTAAVAYRGWLTNGQMFDESKTGADGKIQAFSFKVGSGQVIPGWDQGLTGMKVGGARLVIVPPSVGYGASGQGPIPGNAVLVFQVQLLEVK